MSSTFNEIFVEEIYRPIKPLPVNCRIVDVGAHYGLFAIYAMLKLPVAEILCVEPNPYSFKILSRNIAAANKHGVRIFAYSIRDLHAERTRANVSLEDCETSLGSSILKPARDVVFNDVLHRGLIGDWKVERADVAATVD